MKKRVLSIGIAALLGLNLTGGAAAYTVLDPGSSFAGKSMAGWAAEWITWAFTAPATSNPNKDPTGAWANQNNDGPVFFVASTDSPGSVTRAFDVPEGKALFINIAGFGYDCPGDPSISCGPDFSPDPKPQMLADVEILKPLVTDAYASIDGTPVSDPLGRWERSDFFSAGIAQPGGARTQLYLDDYGYDITGLEIAPTLAFGYYALVTGLSPGLHTLHFGGDFDSGAFEFDVLATVNVVAVPEMQTWALSLLGLGVVGWRARRRRQR